MPSLPRHRLFAGGALLAALILGSAPDAAAQPREKCTQERQEAENHYLEGRFAEAVALLQTCLRRETLFLDEAVAVYRLLGLAHLNGGEPEQAQAAVADLLDLVPTYEADPVQDPPSYTALVNLAREERRAAEEQRAAEERRAEAEPPQIAPPEPPVTAAEERPPPSALRGAKTWLLATGGAVVVFTAVALTLAGGSDGG